jgi:DNA mismatch endonuclease (patch repair protein)
VAIGRSENMRRIRSTNTKPELLLRRELHAIGMRYRLQKRDLPGRPDIWFARQRAAVFVHGCFWHQHPRCIEASTPKSNTDYWAKKLAGNVARDMRNAKNLTALGCKIIVCWECEIERDAKALASRIRDLLTGSS